MSAPALRDALQYMLDRRQILDSGTLAPKVTPLVRIPPNGGEMNQWIAKQVLDIGVFGIIFPHVSTVEEARNAVGACRYPRRPEAPRSTTRPAFAATRRRARRATGGSPSRTTTRAPTCGRWRRRARSWPSSSARRCGRSRTCRASWSEVKGIGVVLIGEGDLSQELGHPREYEHPVVAEAIDRILKICKDHNVPCGHPHPDAKNIERLIASGYRFLMPSTPRSFGVLEQGRKLAGRS